MSNCDNCNAVYKERNLCIALLAQYAQRRGHTVGIKEHQGEEWEDDWRNVLFIDLPSGQVSWHLHKSDLEMFPGIPQYTGNWDNHGTQEKYRRVQEQIVCFDDFIKLKAGLL